MSEKSEQPTLRQYKARVHVTLKRDILDPQGETVGRALTSLGFQGVEGVRVGKVIELSLEAEDQGAARAALERMCKKLLANPVMEESSIELLRAE